MIAILINADFDALKLRKITTRNSFKSNRENEMSGHNQGESKFTESGAPSMVV